MLTYRDYQSVTHGQTAWKHPSCTSDPILLFVQMDQRSNLPIREHSLADGNGRISYSGVER